MQVYWSETQLAHVDARFLQLGRLVASPERPERGEFIFSELHRRNHVITVPEDLGVDHILKVHSPGYIEFLQTIYAQWIGTYGKCSPLIPNVLSDAPPHPRLKSLIGRLGGYAGDLACEIAEGTWTASYTSAQCALNAARFTLQTGNPAYALCRPPGHHAGASNAMGFCYLNNSAIATQLLRKKFSRVAIIDVDVHHGNGTQTIFYDRNDVFTGSMHSDPCDFYPFFSGYQAETGTGKGIGFNSNICYSKGSSDQEFLEAFAQLIQRTHSFKPQALVVALGLDALGSDPHGEHNVSLKAYLKLAEQLKRFGLPTVIVQEGGYISNELPLAVAKFLEVFDH